MNDTPTPQANTISAEQIRVAAQVGVQLLSSETSSIPTAHIEAALILRQVLTIIAQGQAIVMPVPQEAPPAPEPDIAPEEDGAEAETPVQSES